MNPFKSLKWILLFNCVIALISSIETVILEDLNKSDQQSLILTREVSNIFKSQRIVNKQKLTCLTILPSNLTKNNKQKVQKLNLTITYVHKNSNSHKKTEQNLNKESVNQNSKQIIGVYEDYDYDKILDLLHGSCAIHETNQFLYEYCHKQKVRQFDSLFTKERMAKAKFEDISLGQFDYQKAVQNSDVQRDSALKQKSQTFQIEYNQNGDLKILDTLLQSIPILSEKQKAFLKNTLLNEGFETKMQNMAKNQQLKTDPKSNVINNPNNPNGPKITIQTVPIKSAIYDKENLFTVSTVNHKDFYLDVKNSIIHLNYPIIKTNKYFLNTEYTYQVTCQNNVKDRKSLYVVRATLITPFQLIFQGNTSKCEKIIEISQQPIFQKPFNTPFYVPKIRAVQNYLYGILQETCTDNWDWSMSTGKQFLTERINFLQVGTTLLLGITTNISGVSQTRHYPVTIEGIIGPGAVILKEQIGEKLQFSNKQLLRNQFNQIWISNCRLISKKSLNKDSQTRDNKIISNNMIKIKQNNQITKNPGDKMLCLCRFLKYIEQFLQIQLTLGKKIFSSDTNNQFHSYYEFYQSSTVKSYSQKGGKLGSICSAFICYDFAEQPKHNLQDLQTDEVAKSISSKKSFTQITYLTSMNPVISQNLNVENQIILIDIFQRGTIKIHTQSSEGQKYFYLISSSSLIKIRLFPNNTKQIVKQNSFYQNQTRINYQSWLADTLFIHKNYMWRGNDKVVFPRIDFINQRITQIQRVTGTSYIRTLKLQNMKQKYSSYMLSNIQLLIQKHFRVKKYPLFKQQSVTLENEVVDESSEISKQSSQNQEQVKSEKIEDFSKINFEETHFKPLNRSVSLRYQYFHGEFCGEPINKNRRTDVYLQ